MAEQRPPKLIEILLALGSTAAAVYLTLPPQERLWIKLAILQKLHRASTLLAWKTGRKGMDDELKGQDFQRYGIAYRLSRFRDYLVQEMEKMRP